MNIKTTKLKLKNFENYLVYIMGGRKAIATGSWGIINPDGTRKVVYKPVPKVSELEVRKLLPLRVLWVIVQALAFVAGCIIGLALVVAMIVGFAIALGLSLGVVAKILLM